MKDWKKEFTSSELVTLEARYHRKEKNAKARGKNFNLLMEDWLMMGHKLLGRGVCDYTGMEFNTSQHIEENPRWPSVERIDDQKGYVRGNVCVVMRRANEIKDLLVDKKTATTIVDQLDRDIVQAMMLNMSKDHLEKLKTKYIPQEEDQEMKTEETLKKSNEKTTLPKGPTGAVGPQEVGNWDVPCKGVTDKDSKKLPDDVAVALAYANYCKMFSEAGMNVTVTYSQFKARYIRTTCSLTGEKLSGEPKSVLILDLEVGFAQDNFIIVSKAMEKAMTQLMITTKMSLPKITAMLKKVI